MPPAASAAPPARSPALRLLVVEPAAFGGLLHYAAQLGDALADGGHDVDLLVPRGHELAGRPGGARRLERLPRGLAPPPASPGRLRVLARRARAALQLGRSWAMVTRTARRGSYDAVLINGSFDLVASAWLARGARRALPRTVVAHVCHNVRPFNRWGGAGLFLDNPRLERALRDLYPSLDVIFVHGERSRAEFDRLWPGATLVVVPHGDERLFGDVVAPPASEPRALFFGDWRRVKGLDVLLEAFDAVWAQIPEARLTIAGSPSPEEGGAAAVRAWAAQRPGRVDVDPRYVPLEEVPALFAGARVVVLPYRVGYQSGVLHLAGTMGRAVVVSDVGDLPSAVEDGGSGLVVPAGDADALAAALVRVLGDPVLAERLGARGRARVAEASDWGSVSAEVALALTAASAGRRRRASGA